MTLAPPLESGSLIHPVDERLDALLYRAGIAPLDDLGWIRITGDDRVRWLNGMVTNSVTDLQPGRGCYNFLLNAQGRIQGDAYAFADQDALLLQTTRTQFTPWMTLLDRFIIMDDVELANVTADCAGLSLTGPHATAALEAIGLAPANLHPLHKQAATWRDHFVVILHAHSPLVPRYELWSSPEAIAALTQAITVAGAVPITSEAAEHLRILEGNPRYGTDIRNTDAARDLPQETNQTRALHFAKGCYLGQEIVERIRSRGSVHRTFTGFRLQGTLPAPGTSLESNGKPVGELTSTTAIPLQTGETLHLALGYIRREALNSTAPFSYAGGIATPTPLPFASEILKEA